jgi:hypothetical protein
MNGAHTNVLRDTFLDSIADGVFTVDQQWRITSFNRAAERITGVRRGDALGRPCCEVFRASICETACTLRRTLTTGRPIGNCWATRPVPSPTPGRTSRDDLRWPMAARSSWTRSATFPPPCRPACCESCKSGPLSPSGPWNRSRLTCGPPLVLTSDSGLAFVAQETGDLRDGRSILHFRHPRTT